MKAFLLVVVTCGVISAVLGLISFAIMNEMVDKLNRVLPETDRYSSLGWGPIKRLNFHRTYRRYFPEDKLQFWYRAVFFGLAASFVIFTLLLLRLR
jgi:hypothetical protein